MKVILENPGWLRRSTQICKEVKKKAEEMGILHDIYIVRRDDGAGAATAWFRSRSYLALPSNFPSYFFLPKEFTLRHELTHILHEDTRIDLYTIIGIGSFTLLSNHLSLFFFTGISMTAIQISILFIQILSATLIPFLVTKSQEWRADAETCNYLSIREKLQVIDYWVASKVTSRIFDTAPWWSWEGLRDRWSDLTDNHPSHDERIKIMGESLEKLSGLKRVYAKWLFSGRIGFLATLQISALWKSWHYLFFSKKIIQQKTFVESRYLRDAFLHDKAHVMNRAFLLGLALEAVVVAAFTYQNILQQKITFQQFLEKTLHLQECARNFFIHRWRANPFL